MSRRELMEIELEPERHELREPPAYVFSVSRREFLETAGAGLLIVATGLPALGQGQAPTIEARLHIGEDGRLRILTGKVEEGQGPRTELAMAAAEELRVPLSQVDVVMADTDLTPSDGITAGSRTTPGTVPVVRQAAAAARELLMGLAARQWQTPRDTIRVADGSAIDAEGRRRLSYVDMARLPEWSRGASESRLTPSKDWRVLGRGAHRIDGRDIVTGSHRFPSDIQRPGMLYGCVLRPPSYGGTLESVDLEKARKISGVTVVREGPFAACAAPTSFQARETLAMLAAGAKWTEKQHPSSDNLFAYLKEHTQPGGAGGRNRPQERGDATQALASARTKLQTSYTAAYVQHAPMEPRAAVAEWQDGKLTVWTGTSNPFSVRDQLAQAFQIPVQRVRVIVPDMGGGFGGKHTGEAAIEAARLAREAGKPVSVRWTREEEFTWAYFRPAGLIEAEAALDDSKRLLAWSFVNYNSGGSAIDSPYRAPNLRVRYEPCQSPLRPGSYRALASTANNFARECFIDELAAAAGSDPLEFRLANLDNERIREVLLTATHKFRWVERSGKRQQNRGVGLACGTEKNSVVAACVEVEIDPKTGVPRLVEICQAYECGAILNPANLLSQVEGCILMGLGAALREEIQFANGRVKNGRFSTYRVPRFRDVPKMDIVLVDKKESEPIGAGETPIIAVAPAMANAIHAATGRRVRSLPFPNLKA